MQEAFGRAPTPRELAAAVHSNVAFRRVLRTGAHVQQVAMTLQPHETIGWERHGDVDQIIVVLEGSGTLLLGETTRSARPRTAASSVPLRAGTAPTAVIERGTWHDVAAGSAKMRLVVYYTPREHAPGTVTVRKPPPA